jgi:hypothetical protein
MRLGEEGIQALELVLWIKVLTSFQSERLARRKMRVENELGGELTTKGALRKTVRMPIKGRSEIVGQERRRKISLWVHQNLDLRHFPI